MSNVRVSVMQLPDPLINRIQTQISLGDGRVLVLINMFDLNDLSAEEQNTNIYCLNSDQTIAWKIGADAIIGDIDPFVGLFQTQDGTFKAARSSGNLLSIDLLTGESKHTGWRK
jgi:hypothetical protein